MPRADSTGRLPQKQTNVHFAEALEAPELTVREMVRHFAG
jgi:hypothetical protein